MKDLMKEKEFNDLEMQLVEAQKKLEEFQDEIEKLNKINDHLVSQLMHSFDFIQ